MDIEPLKQRTLNDEEEAEDIRNHAPELQPSSDSVGMTGDDEEGLQLMPRGGDSPDGSKGDRDKDDIEWTPSGKTDESIILGGKPDVEAQHHSL